MNMYKYMYVYRCVYIDVYMNMSMYIYMELAVGRVQNAALEKERDQVLTSNSYP
jgi:hypothetical protein